MSSITITDSNSKPDGKMKQFFNQFFTESLSFPANEVDAVIGFFEKRGFEKSSATSVASVLLKQSKLDNVEVFQLLDTLKGLTDVQISAVVAEVLNYNRPASSVLGFKVESSAEEVEKRNILL